MPLADPLLAVDLRDDRTGDEDRVIGAEPHRATEVTLTADDRKLLRHGRDDRVGRPWVELGRGGIGEAELRARELDHHALQSEADPERRDPVRARPGQRAQLALDPAHAESARDEHGVDPSERAFGTLGSDAVVRGDPPDGDLCVVRAGGFAHDAKVTIRWVTSDDCVTPQGAERTLGGVDAVLVPGGFGVRGIEGKLGALTWARTNRVPTLGICLGLQCMVIEFARSELGLTDASSSEFDPGTTNPVVATMAEQLAIVGGEGDLGGTMRLGAYDAVLVPGSIVAEVYGKERVSERHRHRYEVNNGYRAQLEEAGLVVSGVSPDRSLVEFIELPRETHPYYVGTQAHPEFKSRPTRAHPLFAGLIGAALAAREAASTAQALA